MVSATIVRVIPQMPRKAQPQKNIRHQDRQSVTLPSYAVAKVKWSKAIGDRLRSLREGCGVTQTDMYLGLVSSGYPKITQQKISRFESGWMKAEGEVYLNCVEYEDLAAILKILSYTVERFVEENIDLFAQ